MKTLERVQTTFWMDFSIAEKFGIRAVKDTFSRAFNEWKYDIRYITELAMVLNYKIWDTYKQHKALAEVYDELWKQVEDYVYEDENPHYTQEEISFYFNVTD